ncbi:immunoglobulin zeta heavy chain [Triplophysa rosa]|nr:immunoglobulin zeta heavy chain [Triplophysa rosa]
MDLTHFSSKCISLTSSPAQIKTPGDSVRLSCQISGYALSDYGTAWIRHTPGNPLQWIGIIWGSGSIDSGNSFKSRFSISRDTSSNELYLDISSLKTEDTAVYYCAKTHSSSAEGEKLTKTDQHYILSTYYFNYEDHKYLVFHLYCCFNSSRYC